MRQIEKEDISFIIETLDVDRILGKVFFITGSTGALARYCVMTLIELAKQNPLNPCRVVVLCRNMEKAKRIWKEYLSDDNFVLLEGKVEDRVEYEGNVDYIMHAACVSTTQFFTTNPVEVCSANAVGTYNLLMFAKEKNVAGFLFFSSGAVYGGATPDITTYNGLEPLDYKNCYNMSKRLGENLCASFEQEYGVPAKVIRIGYTYGPHSDLDDGHLYSDFLKAIIQKQDLIIKGDGQNYIALTYITDAVAAFFKILFDGKVSTPYVMHNDGEIMKIEELAVVLTQETFKERNLNYKCLKKGKEEKPPSNLRYSILLEDLGWKVKIKTVKGFERTIKCLEE